MKRGPRPITPQGTELTVLHILRDLMLGGRHSRTTVARYGISLPTADRWLKSLLLLPGVVKRREGKVTWYECEE